LPDQHRVSLPVHAPIARHRLPYAGIAALELHGSDISFAPDVGDEHQVEVLVAIDREANASILHAWHPDTNKQTAKNTSFLNSLRLSRTATETGREVSFIKIIDETLQQQTGPYLLKRTGMMPAFQSAMRENTGCAKSKCRKGGLHQPPLLLGKASLGGQKLVAVTVTLGVPGKQCLER
jgi:hypothetical protein